MIEHALFSPGEALGLFLLVPLSLTLMLAPAGLRWAVSRLTALAERWHRGAPAVRPHGLRVEPEL